MKVDKTVRATLNGGGPEIVAQIRQLSPETLTSEALTLEEVFVATLK